MANVQDVARFFIDYGEKSGEPMTNMRVNKMLYFAQGVYLAKEGSPLFAEDIKAWQYGPVVASVYGKYKDFENRPIVDREARFNRTLFTDSEYHSLLDAARIYGVFTTSHLVTLSHRPGGAWGATAQGEAIPNELIRMDFIGEGSKPPFSLALDKIDTVGTRDSNGTLILQREDDDEEWAEYDAL